MDSHLFPSLILLLIKSVLHSDGCDTVIFCIFYYVSNSSLFLLLIILLKNHMNLLYRTIQFVLFVFPNKNVENYVENVNN